MSEQDYNIVFPDHVQAADKGDQGFVYFLQAGPYTKIGKTKDVGRRIKELRIQLPFEAELIHVIYCESDLSLHERNLHNKWAEYRKNGEWFVLPTEYLDNHMGVSVWNAGCTF